MRTLGLTAALLCLLVQAAAADWWPDYGFSCVDRYGTYQEFTFTDNSGVDANQWGYEHETILNDKRFANLKRPEFWCSNLTAPYLDCGPQWGSENWAIGNYFFPTLLRYTWATYIELVPENWSVSSSGGFNAQKVRRYSWCLHCDCMGLGGKETKRLASFSSAPASLCWNQ